MFTGIITAIGRITAVEEQGEDRRLAVETGKPELDDISAGDSISVNGVCLTVTSIQGDIFHADLSRETLACTTFGNAAVGNRVNLEKAMQLSDRLGGHLVSGHTDGVGRIVEMQEDARSVRYIIEAPEELSRYICKKGSICVDGVSLTVNEVREHHFYVNIIPHTMDETIFPDYSSGTRVNLEVDIIARYLERLYSGIT
ncbi:MAG: riboflavin synthase [Gammaproteobacteria bacterium]